MASPHATLPAPKGFNKPSIIKLSPLPELESAPLNSIELELPSPPLLRRCDPILPRCWSWMRRVAPTRRRRRRGPGSCWTPPGKAPSSTSTSTPSCIESRSTLATSGSSILCCPTLRPYWDGRGPSYSISSISKRSSRQMRDPLEDNVVPIVEELRRRLPPRNTLQLEQGEGKENLAGQHDIEAEEDESPFEFRALEVALEAICSFLDARATELETAAYPALDELTSKISSRNLDRVRKLKSAMTRLTARVQKVRDELEQLLDDDDDMVDLYLSRKLAGTSSPVSGSCVPNWFVASPTIGSKISRASRASAATIHGNENDVEELEMLLESYFMQIDGTLNKLTTLREYIDDTEDYINIQLDNHRNQLIQLELFLSTGTVCLSLFSLVAGIFGMNLPYSWNQDHGYIFKWVVISAGLACAFLFILLVGYARLKGLVGS